jgi:transposase
LVILCDRLNAHRAAPVRSLLAQTPDLHVAYLPAYAPELNPVEQVCGYLKGNPLANLGATDVDELAGVARQRGRSLQRKQRLLRSFLAHTPLPLRLKGT